MTTPTMRRAHAEWVYGGGDEVRVPATLGGIERLPIVGSAVEQLAEVCAHLSEPALGDAEAVHPHRFLIEQRRLDAYHHPVVGVCFDAATAEQAASWIAAVSESPGVWGRLRGRTVRVQTTLARLIEGFAAADPLARTPLVGELVGAAVQAAPHFPWGETGVRQLAQERLAGERRVPVFVAEGPHERRVTLYVQASAGWLGELAMIMPGAAVALRGRGFSDAGQSWIVDPLLNAWLTDCAAADPSAYAALDGVLQRFAGDAQRLYADLVERLMGRAASAERAHAAAAGLLGRAVRTEALVTASVAQWQRLIGRYGDFRRDLEGRLLVVGKREGDASVLHALLRSPAGESFCGATLRPSPDGMGRVVDVPGSWGW